MFSGDAVTEAPVTRGGTLPITHVRAKASSRNQTPHSYSTGLEDIGKTAKELDDFKKPEFLLGSGLCLEEVSSPVGLRNPKL